MEIGSKIKDLRLKNGLTQEELADRCELTKGYISQLENDLTSPSISTLMDILASLGTSVGQFFSGEDEEPLCYKPADCFEKVTDESAITWLVPTAQKNAMEPILIRLAAGAKHEDLPHDGEEFGYVLAGRVKVTVGSRVEYADAGSSFYFRSGRGHSVENVGDSECTLIWVSCPPNF